MIYLHPLPQVDISPVTISSSTESNNRIAGTNFSLVCSASIVIMSDSPSPTFEWFLGESNGSIPAEVSPMASTNGNMFSSTLQFTPLQESHTGLYTCRLGRNARLSAKETITVNGMLNELKLVLNIRYIYNSIATIHIC